MISRCSSIFSSDVVASAYEMRGEVLEWVNCWVDGTAAYQILLIGSDGRTFCKSNAAALARHEMNQSA